MIPMLPAWAIAAIIRFGPSILKTNTSNPGAPSPSKKLYEEIRDRMEETANQPYTPPPGMPDYSPSGNDDEGDPNNDPVLPPPPPELPWDRDLPPDPPVDPLVLDLDGDGIKTVALDNNRYFDAEKRVLQQAYIGDQYELVG